MLYGFKWITLQPCRNIILHKILFWGFNSIIVAASWEFYKNINSKNMSYRPTLKSFSRKYCIFFFCTTIFSFFESLTMENSW